MLQNEELLVLCTQMVKVGSTVKYFIKIVSAMVKCGPWTNLNKVMDWHTSLLQRYISTEFQFL